MNDEDANIYMVADTALLMISPSVWNRAGTLASCWYLSASGPIRKVVYL